MAEGKLDRRVIEEFWAQRSQDPSTRWTARDVLEHELAMLREVAPQPSSILDLGSGRGELSRPLAGADARLLAVDFAPANATSFTADNHQFIAATLDELETEETFDLILLFGVVTHLDVDEEVPLYRRMAAWLAEGGVAVVKNQCSRESEFVVSGHSEALGTEYVGRYPARAEQAHRLEEAFSAVEERPYPDRFNPWPNTIHTAFVCRQHGPQSG